jgi:hypothetical protein
MLHASIGGEDPMAKGIILLLIALAPLAPLAAWPAAVKDERQRCACLEGRLDHVESELRRGHSATRGKRLKERQAALEEQRRRDCR